MDKTSSSFFMWITFRQYDGPSTKVLVGFCEKRIVIPRFAVRALLPTQSSLFDGSRPCPRRCRRGSTRRTGYDPGNADPFAFFRRPQTLDGGHVHRAGTGAKAGATGRPLPPTGSSSPLTPLGIPPEIRRRSNDGNAAAIRSSDSSPETRPGRASWNFRRKFPWWTLPGRNSRDTLGRPHAK